MGELGGGCGLCPPGRPAAEVHPDPLQAFPVIRPPPPLIAGMNWLQIDDSLNEAWHFASLEKIFIENRIYRDIEEAETWEEVLGNIDKGLKPHIKHLRRDVTEDDITSCELTILKVFFLPFW